MCVYLELFRIDGENLHGLGDLAVKKRTSYYIAVVAILLICFHFLTGSDGDKAAFSLSLFKGI